MTDARVAGEVVEAIVAPTTNQKRVAGMALEAIVAPDTSDRRLAGLVVEVMIKVPKKAGWGVVLP